MEEPALWPVQALEMNTDLRRRTGGNKLAVEELQVFEVGGCACNLYTDAKEFQEQHLSEV
ncbi:hypothetical protein AYX22_12840 [Arthrobacter sp. D5-1]|nr:hypothetical protein AYX22_12840 [Arthrobacter sp. D5-1]